MIRNRTKKVRQRKHKRVSRHKKRVGGAYTEVTSKTVEGTPLIDGAFVSVPGFGSMSINGFKRYMESIDRNGIR
jgi:hypothetical protein